MYSPDHPATEVDVFVEAPLDFDQAFRAAARMDVSPRASAIFVGLDDLLSLKRQAGRPQDLQDIDRLQAIRREESSE